MLINNYYYFILVVTNNNLILRQKPNFDITGPRLGLSMGDGLELIRHKE